ncbi:MAG TPA: RIP metalloprotease RseP [Alphaproteobacteria bacterium]|nr:RIP metalloprotease RseP [Alphaproteobacteria bacterium]
MIEYYLHEFLQYTAPFLAVLGVVVFVHEFGHYWVARHCGVKIEVFSIGFGHELFGWTDKAGTRWKVCWLPLGGYVKMFGDGSAASTPGQTVHDMNDDEKKISFFHQHVDRRMAVVAAGPLTNYLFAIVLMSLLFMLAGQPFTPPVVNGVVKGDAAARAGLDVGDRILTIDGHSIENFEDIQRLVSLNTGTPVTMQVERSHRRMAFTLTPDFVKVKDIFGETQKLGRIGIRSGPLEYKMQPPLEAIHQATLETWQLTAATLKGIGQIVTGTRSADQIGGPLRIADLSGHVAKEGGAAFVWFMAVISINLGLINLFPIPLLDGGHLAFYLAERLRGRPLSERIQAAGAHLGLFMVLSLMVFATWNDLVQLKVIAYLRGLFS